MLRRSGPSCFSHKRPTTGTLLATFLYYCYRYCYQVATTTRYKWKQVYSSSQPQSKSYIHHYSSTQALTPHPTANFWTSYHPNDPFGNTYHTPTPCLWLQQTSGLNLTHALVLQPASLHHPTNPLQPHPPNSGSISHSTPSISTTPSHTTCPTFSHHFSFL